MKYLIQNQQIEITTNDKVFKPSVHGASTLGSSVKINKGETVLDVGTGSGLMAILAAKLGGIISATDILPEAVASTQDNAKANSVIIETKIGDLFEKFEGKKFDVIIANLPQENLSPKIINSSQKEIVTGMDGGSNGNEIILKLLAAAPEHMHTKSRLYVVAYSMSNHRETLKFLVEHYNTKLINFYTGPVKDYLYSDLGWYLNESQKGNISIYKKGDKYFADVFVFELTLK